MIALLLVLALATPEADVKRARDRHEFGAIRRIGDVGRGVFDKVHPLPYGRGSPGLQLQRGVDRDAVQPRAGARAADGCRGLRGRG